MKKLIALLKRIFCGVQDHTENIVTKDPDGVDVVMLDDDVNTIVEESDDCDHCCNCEECECCECDCEAEESEADVTVTEESEEGLNDCNCEECECECTYCNCEYADEECKPAVVVVEDVLSEDESCDECESENTCYVAEDVLSENEVKNIVAEELNKWGANPDNVNYMAVVAMVGISKAESYDDLLNQLSEILNKSKAALSNSFKSLVGKSDFSKSEYVDISTMYVSLDYYKDIIYSIYKWIKTF